MRPSSQARRRHRVVLQSRSAEPDQVAQQRFNYWIMFRQARTAAPSEKRGRPVTKKSTLSTGVFRAR
jgi:hypothetical protein